MLAYKFFDYKDFIPDVDKQNVMWSIPHIVFIILASLSIVLLCFFLRKTKSKNIENYLKTISIIMPILEIIKIVTTTTAPNT